MTDIETISVLLEDISITIINVSQQQDKQVAVLLDIAELLKDLIIKVEDIE